MKVVYSGVQRESYDPKRGMSFEYNNFYLTLKNMAGITVIERPFDRILEVGKKRFNEELLDVVLREKPDLFFAFMYTDELNTSVLAEIKKKTTSVAWFADDYWRFFNYSRHWPPYFSKVITTCSRAVDWYKKSGYDNVILSQWACNTAVFKPVAAEKDIDVSFVGQMKSGRVRVIEALRRAGVNVKCFGFGWPNGKISHEEMLEVFGRSKICLNLTDRKKLWDPSIIARLFLKKSVNRIVPDFHFIDNLRAYLHFPILHTHARPFELAGCGAFTISGRSEDIGKYYEENKEMVFYDGVLDLTGKIKYYLAHDAEREKIAEAGYERTIREHTYEKRFREIFKIIGL
jgi:spore maturation protein CgeB